MTKMLYISMTGMTEPLGESQVVQYLLELAKKQTIYLLSFEKPTDKSKHAEMEQKLNRSGIQWMHYEYSNRYGVFSTAWQIIIAFFMLKKLVRKHQIQIVHTRSLVPAVIGMCLKKFCQVKLLFDIRGFAIDEKITEGRLKPESLLSKTLKKLEAYVYKNSDHVVTLTHASKPIIENLYLVNANNITVIPTCANVELFSASSAEEKMQFKENLGFSKEDFVLLHNGSLNGFVDFEAEVKLFAEMSQLNKNIKCLFLNKGQHDLIAFYAEKYRLNKENYKILAIDFDKISRYLNVADLCVFFIKPSFSKQASAPTKFAEMVACHLPSVTNTKYGDMEYYLSLYKVGTLLDLEEVHNNPKQAAEKIMKFIAEYRDSDRAQDFNELFSQHFSRELAVQSYQHIYDRLIAET